MTYKEESVDLSDMAPLEGDEAVKEGKLLKIFNSNKLLTRFTILLAQTKAETIHTNQKTESGKHIFCISAIKSPKNLQQFNQVIIIIEENMIV